MRRAGKPSDFAAGLIRLSLPAALAVAGNGAVGIDFGRIHHRIIFASVMAATNIGEYRGTP
jgi:hypothetical protein